LDAIAVGYVNYIYFFHIMLHKINILYCEDISVNHGDLGMYLILLKKNYISIPGY
jgi:hypothetical protein